MCCCVMFAPTPVTPGLSVVVAQPLRVQTQPPHSLITERPGFHRQVVNGSRLHTWHLQHDLAGESASCLRSRFLSRLNVGGVFSHCPDTDVSNRLATPASLPHGGCNGRTSSTRRRSCGLPRLQKLPETDRGLNTGPDLLNWRHRYDLDLAITIEIFRQPHHE